MQGEVVYKIGSYESPAATGWWLFQWECVFQCWIPVECRPSTVERTKMTISEYMRELEATAKEHGDLDVEHLDIDGRWPARQPAVAFRKILTGRKSRPAFWSSFDPESERGEKVVRV